MEYGRIINAVFPTPHLFVIAPIFYYALPLQPVVLLVDFGGRIMSAVYERVPEKLSVLTYKLAAFIIYE